MGIRTPVTAVKGRCPRPLDDGDPDKTALCSLVLGGGKRDRTADLLHAMQALSQLSYTPSRRQPNYGFGLATRKAGFPATRKTGGVDGTRTRDPRRDRPVF